MIYFGQFNHVDNDRQYLDSDIAAMLSLLTGGPGVINHPAGGLLVANVTGLQISVAAGGAWLGSPAGWYYYSDDEQLITLDSETSGYNRIDRVVLRLNRNTEVRTVALDVVKGVATTSSAVAPALTQNDTLYEMPLARIAITGGSTSIAITDERDLIATASSALIAEDVINNLTSTDADAPLSAYQGKVLKALVDAKVAINDIVNTLIGTDTDKPLSAYQGKVLKALVDAKMSLSGGTFTGGVTHNDIITQLYTKYASLGYLILCKGSGAREIKAYWTGTGTGNTVSLEVVAADGTSRVIATIEAATGVMTFNVAPVVPSLSATAVYSNSVEAKPNGSLTLKSGSASTAVVVRATNLQAKTYDNSAFTNVVASDFNQSSSRRWKENIVAMVAADIAKLLDVRVVNFTYKQDFTADGGGTHMGVIAEELLDLFPDAVTLEDGLPAYVDYSKLVVPCIGMIQQQEDRIASLESKSAALTALLVSKGLLTQEEIDGL